jgi:hypothetical protein
MANGIRHLRRVSCALLALAALGACQRPMDMDLRDLGDGFSTTDAALSALERPEPDARGVISYPTYQVAVAQEGDTLSTVAGRVGLDAATLASYNGLTPDAPLRADEIVALPSPRGRARGRPRRAQRHRQPDRLGRRRHRPRPRDHHDARARRPRGTGRRAPGYHALGGRADTPPGPPR